jgi:hypothetical protein
MLNFIHYIFPDLIEEKIKKEKHKERYLKMKLILLLSKFKNYLIEIKYNIIKSDTIKK